MLFIISLFTSDMLRASCQGFLMNMISNFKTHISLNSSDIK